MNWTLPAAGALAALTFLSLPLAAQTPLRLVRVAAGLSRPVGVEAPRGDRGRIFIVEQVGRIRIVKDGRLLAQPFLDLSGKVRCCGERGLLGLAFHPNYATNGLFFVNYTDGSGATVVERFQVSSTNPDRADATSGRPVLGPIAQPFSNHNGGCIQFGRDGFLYIALGDGGSGGDPGCRAQSGATLLGKLLRIEVSTSAVGGYTVPASNPFVGNPAVADEIWSLGLRNPWKFSFDRQNGDIYIGDVGQQTREEINRSPGTSPGGENYGWKIMEGTTCFSTSSCPTGTPACRSTTFTDPIYEYGRTIGQSITGGYVYRGCAIPDLRGTYFFGDYASGRIWSFRYVNGVTQFQERTAELGWNGLISSFGEDGCGELHLCRYSSTNGEVYRVVAGVGATAVDLGFGKVGGNGKVPEFSACGLLTSGLSAEFRLFDAPANSLALLLVSTSQNPTPLFGGTVVPLPTALEAVLAANSDGTVAFTAPGGGGPLTLYAQYLIRDPGASGGVGISNALQINLGR